MKKAITNESLVERVQRERRERRFAKADKARRALPREIVENDITWPFIIKMGGKLAIGAIAFLALLIATIMVAYFFMPL